MVGCFDGRGFRELGFRVDVIAGLGACAPCVFQRLRQVGKELDGELLLLRARSGPVTSSNRRRHPCGHAPSLPLAFAESRIPRKHPGPRLSVFQ